MKNRESKLRIRTQRILNGSKNSKNLKKPKSSIKKTNHLNGKRTTYYYANNKNSFSLNYNEKKSILNNDDFENEKFINTKLIANNHNNFNENLLLSLNSLTLFNEFDQGKLKS
jgi:hypothetical protein